MKLFFGHTRHALDAKNRVRFPSRFSDRLGAEFYLAKGGNGFLYCFDEEAVQKYADKYMDTPLYAPTGEQAESQHYFSSMEAVSLDAQGRLLIPKELAAYAKFGKEVVISGAGDKIEIWNADIYDDMVGKKDFKTLLQEIGKKAE